MVKIGQIIEIPINSLIYKENTESYNTKEEELISKTKKREYTLFDGFIVGEHYDINNFRLGQRKGINISGKTHPLYVIGISKKDNRLFVGQSNKHPGLYTNIFSFHEKNITWNKLIFSDTPIVIEVSSPLLTNKTFANLYKFNQVFFLEFSTKIEIDIMNYPIELLINNELKTIINK